MSGVLAFQLCVFGLATFDVRSGHFTTVDVGVLVSVLFSTVACEPVTIMHLGNSARCCQRVWRCRSSCVKYHQEGYQWGAEKEKLSDCRDYTLGALVDE